MSSEGGGSVDLYWIPLGAGAHVVRRSGRCFEALCAFFSRRPRRDLYHSALQVTTPAGSYVIEMTPVSKEGGAARGVVGEGAVGVRWAGRLRLFRYEVRCWPGGCIPDIADAVGGAHRLSANVDQAERVLQLIRRIPTPVWGRDELGAGEMWNSNSVTSWVLAGAGFDVAALHPPDGGRAPGWDAGVAVAARLRWPPAEAAPGFLPPVALRSWAELAAPTTTGDDVFQPDAVTALPAPVARWLRHTIAPGTPRREGVMISMHGTIRIGRWLPFTASQIVAPSGYLWAADAGRLPFEVRGFDRYDGGEGEMSWRLLGRLPVVAATGPDVSRSAAGRLASELIGLTPGAALGPAMAWQGIDEHSAVATVAIDGADHEVTVTVDDLGRLCSISLPRWGNPDKGPFRLHTFGVVFAGEFTDGGYTLPRTLRAGWWLGSPRWERGEFFRATIDGASFF